MQAARKAGSRLVSMASSSDTAEEKERYQFDSIRRRRKGSATGTCFCPKQRKGLKRIVRRGLKSEDG